jgi:hypothetical protein
LFGETLRAKGTAKRQDQTQYEGFLDLRKDADPGIPEVADAKVRLAALSR